MKFRIKYKDTSKNETITANSHSEATRKAKEANKGEINSVNYQSGGNNLEYRH